MKRKGICRLWALLLTAVLCITAFSVTAFACENPENGDFDAPAEETEAEVPTLPEDFQSVIGNIDLEGLDLSAIRDAILSLLGGAGDTPETSEPPLTPDGNLTLIDDIGSDRTGGKQFITVQTKNGKSAGSTAPAQSASPSATACAARCGRSSKNAAHPASKAACKIPRSRVFIRTTSGQTYAGAEKFSPGGIG